MSVEWETLASPSHGAHLELSVLSQIPGQKTPILLSCPLPQIQLGPAQPCNPHVEGHEGYGLA